jgi:isocitrate dehydrogenase
LRRVNGEGLKLTMISNRGVKVWPGGHTETFCSDHWRCRFLAESGEGKVSHTQVISLLGRVAGEGYDFIKTEGLYTFDGQRGFSLDQGE